MGVCSFVESSYCNVGFPGGAVVKNPPASAGDRFDPYAFSILAWKIPWTGEPGRLQSMGSQRGGHN